MIIFRMSFRNLLLVLAALKVMFDLAWPHLAQAEYNDIFEQNDCTLASRVVGLLPTEVFNICEDMGHERFAYSNKIEPYHTGSPSSSELFVVGQTHQGRAHGRWMYSGLPIRWAAEAHLDHGNLAGDLKMARTDGGQKFLFNVESKRGMPYGVWTYELSFQGDNVRCSIDPSVSLSADDANCLKRINALSKNTLMKRNFVDYSGKERPVKFGPPLIQKK